MAKNTGMLELWSLCARAYHLRVHVRVRMRVCVCSCGRYGEKRARQLLKRCPFFGVLVCLHM